MQDVRELVETLRTVDEDDEGFVPAAGGWERVPAVTGEAQLRDLIAADATEGRIRLDETGDGAPVGGPRPRRDRLAGVVLGVAGSLAVRARILLRQ